MRSDRGTIQSYLDVNTWKTIQVFIEVDAPAPDWAYGTDGVKRRRSRKFVPTKTAGRPAVGGWVLRQMTEADVSKMSVLIGERVWRDLGSQDEDPYDLESCIFTVAMGLNRELRNYEVVGLLTVVREGS